MKKILFILCFAMIFLNPVSVRAAETTNSETEEYIPPYPYGEIVDGCFVRTMAQEQKDIPKDRGVKFIGQEARKINEARMVELTPEMEAAGYWMGPDGIIQDPGTEFGDAGEGVTTEIPVNQEDIQYGYLTIAATVEDVIEQPCFIEIRHEDGDLYNLSLEPINKFTTTTPVPAGIYTIESGGIKSDFTSEFPLNTAMWTFEVLPDNAQLVVVTIGDITKNTEEKEEIVVEEPEDIPEPIIEEDNNNILLIIIVVAAIFIGIIITGLFVKMKKDKGIN